MNESASAFKLGLFVIVSVLLLFAGLVTLGAGAFLKRTIRVEAYFVEAVQGLDVGAAVKQRGVTIGRVSHIGFVLDRYPLPSDATPEQQLASTYVLVELELDATSSVTELLIPRLATAVEAGLRARLASAGLMGVVFVELVGVDPERHPPQTIYWTPDLPYVPTTFSVIGSIADTLQTLADQIGGIDTQGFFGHIEGLVNSVQEKVDQLDISRVQGDAIALLDEVRASNHRLKEILDGPELEATLADVAATAANVRRITTDAEPDIMVFVHELPKLVESAEGTIERIRAFVDDPQLKTLVENLSNTAEAAGPAAVEARLLLRRINAMVLARQDEIEAIIAGLELLVENANALVEDAARNPARLIFGEPPPPVNPAETGTRGRR